MSKYVITYTTDDGYSYSCEVHKCLEFEGSLDELKFELELFWDTHSCKTPQGSLPKFYGLEFDIKKDLSYKDGVGNYQYDEPLVQTLDEWFNSNLEKGE